MKYKKAIFYIENSNTLLIFSKKKVLSDLDHESKAAMQNNVNKQ